MEKEVNNIDIKKKKQRKRDSIVMIAIQRKIKNEATEERYTN